ncbi:enoyl-CoA hydratase/isomerase family protein [Nocardioides sp. LHD-245]|uniref:enoyl-CoA hydratase/isomerase family protein n=1 Tax=Nocardioides sp. LHD-245 TaxID=3051387 RepID=UPI0027E03253|nr:enoyl-CoA hydratase/isomerase family protein [Nocardioides sp. LHD-245]
MALVESWIRPDGAGELRLNFPEKRNSLSHALVDEVAEAMDKWEATDVEVAVLSAVPPIFCAGNDLVEARTDRQNAAADRMVELLLERPIFWIMAASGPLLGAGVTVAAITPVVIADENAWLALPEREIGLFPAGVLTYVEDQWGSRRSLALGLSGERMSPTEAVQRDVYTELVESGRLDERVDHWCALAVERPQVTRAARRTWQGRFSSSAASERGAFLKEVLDSQSFDNEVG